MDARGRIKNVERQVEVAKIRQILDLDAFAFYIVQHLDVQVLDELLNLLERFDGRILDDVLMVGGGGLILGALLEEELQAARILSRYVAALLAHLQDLLHVVFLQTVDLELLSLGCVLEVSDLVLPRQRLLVPEFDQWCKFGGRHKDGIKRVGHLHERGSDFLDLRCFMASKVV